MNQITSLLRETTPGHWQTTTWHWIFFAALILICAYIATQAKKNKNRNRKDKDQT